MVFAPVGQSEAPDKDDLVCHIPARGYHGATHASQKRRLITTLARAVEMLIVTSGSVGQLGLDVQSATHLVTLQSPRAMHNASEENLAGVVRRGQLQNLADPHRLANNEADTTRVNIEDANQQRLSVMLVTRMQEAGDIRGATRL